MLFYEIPDSNINLQDKKTVHYLQVDEMDKPVNSRIKN